MSGETAAWEALRVVIDNACEGQEHWETVLIADAVWPLVREARAAAVAPLEKALRDADLELDAHGCEYESIRAPIRALLSAPSPVREPEGLDVERLARYREALEIIAADDPPGPERMSISIRRRNIAQLALKGATPERPADEVDG